jgi:hypothetical protein
MTGLFVLSPISDMWFAIKRLAMSCGAADWCQRPGAGSTAQARPRGPPSFASTWRCWRGSTFFTAEIFTAEMLTLRGLVTYYVLFFIHLESRRVAIAGITVRPDELWMKQMARNVTHYRSSKTQSIWCAVVPTSGTELEQDMKEKTHTSSEPSWLDPRNDRKTPFTDAELDVLADDFIARMADTQAWQDLVADVGEQQAREVVKQRLAGQDANSLINWEPDGPLNWSVPNTISGFGGTANAGGQGAQLGLSISIPGRRVWMALGIADQAH